MSIIKVMGVDPSLRNTGMALAHIDTETGVPVYKDIAMVQTKPATKTKQQRQSSADLVSCRELYVGLHKQISIWKPDLVTGEVPSGAQSARAALSFGFSTMLLASIPVPIIEVTPREVKMASVGASNASKEQMMQWARDQAPDLPWKIYRGSLQLDNEHMADACAAIAACTDSTQFLQLLALWSRKAA